MWSIFSYWLVIFKTFIDRLVEKEVIIEILSRGPTKCLVVAKIPNSSHYRRVDFLFSPPEEFPFAILYFTGSKEFNTSMREKALKMEVTLNEHGFSKMEGRKKGEKIDMPELINRIITSKKKVIACYDHGLYYDIFYLLQMCLL